MSDIGLRLDGLLLGALLAAGAVVFALVSAVAALRAVATASRRERSWRFAAQGMGIALAQAAALAVLIAYLAVYGTPAAGPDWIDWLTLPWLGFILVASALLLRSWRRRSVWRAMQPADVPGVVEVARLAFPHHFEDRSCFAERLALYPAGCFTLEIAGRVAGYLIAYPWTAGSAPPLNSLIGALPADASVIYLHDLALHPRARGKGLTSGIIDRLAMQARADGWDAIALVAVNEAAGFWARAGFAAVDGPAMAAKLTSYGANAVYMQRALRSGV